MSRILNKLKYFVWGCNGRFCCVKSLVKRVLIVLRSWIIVSWIVEFAIMIFGVEFRDDSLGGVNESVEMDAVMDVGVEVVLPVLDFIHVSLNDFISSNSWERESFVEELPGVNWWQFKL